VNSIERRDDSGAALILALILITVVAVVTSAVLSLNDTNVRATVQLRSQASTASTADGAAQVAINAIRKSTYSFLTNGANCFQPANSPSLALDNFPTAGTSAFVSCSPDPGSDVSVVVNNNNKPANAILVLGSVASEGLQVTVNGVGGGGVLGVGGNVFSHSQISVNGGGAQLWVMPPVPGQALLPGQTAAWVRATAGAGCTGAGQIKSTDIVCNDPAGDIRGADPAYPAPGPDATSVVRTPPTAKSACPGNTKPVITFSPGVYTNAALLNALTDNGGCKSGTIFKFTPGTYYFDFGTAGGTSDVWNLNNGGYLVGGNQSGSTPALTAGTAPTIPGACDNPLLTEGSQGVQFVFGGDSQLVVNHAQAELCGTWFPNAVPITIYGLKTALSVPGAPGGSVPAEGGCTIATPYPSGSTCAALLTTSAPNSVLFVQGTTYLPNAAVDVTLNNVTRQIFESGIFARTLFLTTPSSFTSPPGGIIQVPSNSPGYTNADDVVYLTAYVCANQSTGCTSAVGKLSLRAKIDLYSTGSPSVRVVTVNSWSVQR
jgi:Tfp pilus assembly protein PilX